MVQKLVVAMRPGETMTPAVQRGREVASAFRDTIDVLVVSTLFDSHLTDHRAGDNAQVGLMRDAMIAAEQEKLEQVRSHFDGVCREADVRVVWSADAAGGVIAVAREFGADLIVASTHKHAKLSRKLFSNTDWELMRRSPLPILFARETSFRPYKTVVAAVDPMHSHDKPASLDDSLVAAGRGLADAFQGDLQLLHVYPRIGLMAMAEYTPPPELFKSWEREHRAEVAKLADKNGIAADHVHFAADDPERAIPELVSAINADLIVMGSVSRSSFQRWMIGHTAESVLDQIDCDVLVVRASNPVSDTES